ncbi:hypothetical protein ACRN93_19500 [Shewanella baltica]|uniref:hypothetical protein n=1 Tax=Shewanella TaxID=22 RepID=UPI0015E2C951|nr:MULTISPECIES: hypothetical protein [unclassified Shewanella]
MNARAKLFNEGRDLWGKYVNLHGYSWEPTDKGLTKLVETTGIKKSELRKRIPAFLSA